MAIYRGPGGAGDATADATNAASVAEGFADAAGVSAAAAASSASGASAAQTASEAAQAAAEAAQSAAETAETNAETAETNAETAQTAAEAAQTAAETAQAAAETAETNAQAYELSANNWATKTDGAVAGGEYSAKYHAQAAASSASSASTAAVNAISAQTAAESARDATLAAYDSFDDRYLGAKSSDPALDNDGNALVAGALYFNTVDELMKLYTGSAWVAAYVSGEGFVATSDIGVTVQAYDADTAKLDVAQTFTAQQTFGELKETVFTLGTSGSIALDPANGSIQSSTLSGNPTFTDSLEAGQVIVLMLNGGASYTVTWPTITWATATGNVAPTLTANDTLVLWKVSTTLYGAYVGSYA